MTCTNQQIKILMRYINIKTLEIAAAKADMSIKTAKKYLRLKKLPSEFKVPRNYSTRLDPFAKHWEQIENILKTRPGLQANQLLMYLIEEYPDHYNNRHLRSLQRRLQIWNAENGINRDVIFPQDILPGKQSQSDWTNMNSLKITINKQPFNHLLFHFMLPYSRWESVMICYSESLDSLTSGYEKAVWELGGTMPEHRTDNLSAATKKSGNKRTFTEKWKEFLDYYKVQPSRNNPGVSHENGSVEKSHDILKNAVRQQLIIRGHKDFSSLDEYQVFIDKIINKRNSFCKKSLAIEEPSLQKLPDTKWLAPIILDVRVNTASVVNILKMHYSVPSRLIGYHLRAYVYPNNIELYYGSKCLQKMPRVFKEDTTLGIDYRHIIDSLVRKPGAFFNYRYRQCLFPQTIFRKTYDKLIKLYPNTGHKIYLKILQLAKMYGEQQIARALKVTVEQKKKITIELLKENIAIPQKIPIVKIQKVPLSNYDQLHNFIKKENKS